MVGQKTHSVSHSVVSSSLQPHGLQPLGSSVHRISQTRTLEWVAIAFSRVFSQPRDQTRVSHIAGSFFILSAIREAPKDLIISMNQCQENQIQSQGSSFSVLAFPFFFLTTFTTWHVGSQFFNQGSNLHSLQWKYSVLTTGPQREVPPENNNHYLVEAPKKYKWAASLPRSFLTSCISQG